MEDIKYYWFHIRFKKQNRECNHIMKSTSLISCLLEFVDLMHFDEILYIKKIL